ncbi:hypothetical protein ACW5F0_05960 [Luteimonas sp. A534]
METAAHARYVLVAIAKLTGNALEELDCAKEDFKSGAAPAAAARATSPLAALQPIVAR